MAEIVEVIHRINYEVNDAALLRQFDQLNNLVTQLGKVEKSGSAVTRTVSQIGAGIMQGLGLGGGVAGIAASATAALKDLAVECVKTAISADRIETAFNKLDNPGLLQQMRQATRGTVSDVELMRTTLYASKLNVPIENMATLFEYARQRAKETGEQVNDVAREIIQGIGTRSADSLEALGVKTQNLGGKFTDTKVFAEAAFSAISVQAKSSGVEVDNLADKADRISTKFENFKRNLGVVLADAGTFLFEGLANTNEGRLIGSAVDGLDQYVNGDKYAKAAALKRYNKYIEDYNKADANGKQQLMDEANSHYRNAQQAERNYRQQGLKSQADIQKGFQVIIEKFFDDIKKKAEAPPKSQPRPSATGSSRAYSTNGEVADKKRNKNIPGIKLPMPNDISRETIPEGPAAVPEKETAQSIEMRKRSEENKEKFAKEEEERKAKEAEALENRKKLIKSTIEGYQVMAQAAVEAFKIIYDAQVAQLDNEISMREKRVEDARKLAERGNTEALKLEEERLAEAHKKKEKYARREAIMNSALALSNSLVAVTGAIANAVKGDPYTIAVRVAAAISAVIGALAAGYAFVQSFSASNTQAFADGVIDYRGKGGPRDDANWVRISSGESVITAKGTAANRGILEAINRGAEFRMLDTNMLAASTVAGVHHSFASKDNVKTLEKKLDGVIDAVKDSKLKQDIFFNEHGVGLMTQRAVRRDQNRFK